jgi:ankyrin repeat protein
LVFLACWVTTAKAEGWDDFANNLATDLAPLLALFGEQVTKQFLSESITTLDNFIFAMAPLGIITAVVSAIRVCGAPSLRAFIGRANEGGGIAEAELCSSTSRDVCELYHNGAIVRVFGRPKILEIVHDHDGADFWVPREFWQTPLTCGIYPFREYIKTVRAKEAGWEEIGKRVRRGTEPEDTESQKDPPEKRISDSDDDDADDKFAPNPNLSVNIGIRKRPRHVMWLSAITGFVAQASVLVVGFLVTYTWAWTKDDSLPPSWAFPLMSCGTVLLCAGMFSCALLVERSTRERVFRKSGEPATLHVVQPGNQIIGDQTFDSFSVAASLKEYTTSWKTPQHPATGRGAASAGREETFDRSSHGASPLAGKLDQLARLVSRYGVWLATAMTMSGFVLQFVGLRAMHSVVSVVQLGAILLMSIIRASLRTQRLPQEQNRLRDRPDEVEGYELDWLALQMGKEEGVVDQARRSWSVIPRPPTPETDSDSQLQDLDPPVAERTFYYRARLAELTSQSQGVGSKSSTAWGEHLVHARQRARQLRTAIESSTRYLSDHAQVNPAWQNPWTVDVVEHDSESSPSQRTSTACVSLYCPQHSNKPAAWGVNQHFLEAVVGLWTWSVVSNPRTEKVDKFGLRASTASEVPAYRILAVGATAEDIRRAYTELRFWADDFPPVSTMKWTAMVDPVERSPHTLLWRTNGDEISTRASPGTPKKPNLRLYGWPIWDPSKPFILATRMDNPSVSAACAQEIYQSFFCAVTAAIDFPGAQTRPTKGNKGLYFENEIMSSLAATFEQSGLGSKQDAYSVIIPALRLRSKLPLPSDAVPVVHSAAEDAWKEGHFWDAYHLLKWAWNHSRLAETMMQLGELYRHALFSKNAAYVDRGREGISQMKQDAGDESVGDICDRYEGLLRNLDDLSSNRHPTAQDVITAIAGNDRGDSLWLISQAEEVLTPDAGGRAVLSWAAQRGWLEVVKTALEIGSVVNSEDDAKRTPLSYAAEHGHADVVRLLMDKGALPITEDSLRRTPLSYAAAKGHCVVMEVLLSDPRVTVYTKDNNGFSPLHWAARWGQEEAIELLLRQKAQIIDDRDLKGRPPLMIALLSRRIHTAEMLVANGAKFDFRLEGIEAWRWAIKYGEWACATFLLELANRGSLQKKSVIVKAFKRFSKHPEAKKPVVLPEAAPKTEVQPYVVSEAGAREEITIETVRRAADGYYDIVTWICEQGDIHPLGELEFDESNRFKLVGLLLDYLGEEIKVTEDVVRAAAGSWFLGEDVMRLLLAKRGREVKITEDVVKKAAGNEMAGERVMRLLLVERGNEVKVTEDVVKAAAANTMSGLKLMELLLAERGNEVRVTGDVVKAAVGNDNYGKQVIELLQAQRDKEFKEIVVTEAMVKVAAGNVVYGASFVQQLLIERGKMVTVTEDIVKAAAGNRLNGDSIISLLLVERGKEVKVTADVVKAAAANESREMGEKVMRLLLDGRAEIVDLEKVMEATSREFGESMAMRLLGTEDREVEVTEDGVKAAEEDVSAE